MSPCSSGNTALLLARKQRKHGGKTTHSQTYNKKTAIYFVQHKLEKSESLYFLWLKLEWLMCLALRTGSLPTAIGQRRWTHSLQVGSPTCTVKQQTRGWVLHGERQRSRAARQQQQVSPSPSMSSSNKPEILCFPAVCFTAVQFLCVIAAPPRAGNNRPEWQELTKVTHQLESSREGPALQPPPARDNSKIKQYYITPHCRPIFTSEMQLLLHPPPRRSRGSASHTTPPGLTAPISPAGARQAPTGTAAHARPSGAPQGRGTFCHLPWPPARGPRNPGTTPVHGVEQGGKFSGAARRGAVPASQREPEGGTPRRPSPFTVTFGGEGCAPTARPAAGGSPIHPPQGRGSYLKRRSGAPGSAAPSRAGPAAAARVAGAAPPPAPGAALGAEPRRGWSAGAPAKAAGVSRPCAAPRRRRPQPSAGPVPALAVNPRRRSWSRGGRQRRPGRDPNLSFLSHSARSGTPFSGTVSYEA